MALLDDQKVADEIKRKVDDLNKLIETATNRKLLVDIRLSDKHNAKSGGPQKQMKVFVYSPL